MNYYPSYYATNPYGSYNMQVPPQQQQQVQPQQVQSIQSMIAQQQAFQQPMLNGKIVDSADIVKVTEVPVGGYGVFPRADMGEVYIKTWGQDGTTQIITYKPVPPPQAPAPEADINAQLLERLSTLESKIDNIMLTAFTGQQTQIQKEVNQNEQQSTNATNSTVTAKF